MTTTRTSPKKEAAVAEAEAETKAEHEEPVRVPVPDPDNRCLDDRVAAVLQEVDRIQKRGRNQKFGYSFVTESDVVDAIRGACGRHGVRVRMTMIEGDVELVQITGEDDSGNRTSKGVKRTQGFRVIVSCRGPNGREEDEHYWQGEAWDYPGEKAIPKVVTMAKKTFLIANFLLSSGDDVEASSDGDRDATETTGRGAGGARSGGRTMSVSQIGMLIAKGKDAGMSASDVRTLVGLKAESRHPLGFADVVGHAPGDRAFVDSVIQDISVYSDGPDACKAALKAYRDRVLDRVEAERLRAEAEAAQAASGEPATESPSGATPSETSNPNAEGPPARHAPAQRRGASKSAEPVSDTDEALFREPSKSDPEPPAWSTPATKECTCDAGDAQTDPAMHRPGCDLSIPF
jgi:ERF superfamily